MSRNSLACRTATAAIGAAVFAANGHAGSGPITFDELEFHGPLTTIAADHYLDQGVLFGAAPYVVDVSSGYQAQIAQFIAGGGTPDNALVLATTIDQLHLDIMFHVPGTMTPAVTDWFSAAIFDTDVGTMLGAIEAYDIDGRLLGSVDATTTFAFAETLTIAAKGIHRIRLISDADGTIFDTLNFGTLVPANPGDVPAPGALALLALSGLGRRRRRRTP